MKRNISLKIQVILSYSFIILSIVAFVFSLGFMTNGYQLFLKGTSEMVTYYKELQVLNKEIFNISLKLVIFSVLLVAFDINKREPGIFGTAFIALQTVYTYMSFKSLMTKLPIFKTKYLEFDYSKIKDFTPSTFVFDFGSLLYKVFIVVSILLLISVVVNYTKGLKEAKKSGGLSNA